MEIISQIKARGGNVETRMVAVEAQRGQIISGDNIRSLSKSAYVGIR